MLPVIPPLSNTNTPLPIVGSRTNEQGNINEILSGWHS